jgi:hypothetical protein
MHDARADLRNRIHQRVRTDGNDRRHAQRGNQNGYQQNTAAQSRQPDKKANDCAGKYSRNDAFWAHGPPLVDDWLAQRSEPAADDDRCSRTLSTTLAETSRMFCRDVSQTISGATGGS